MNEHMTRILRTCGFEVVQRRVIHHQVGTDHMSIQRQVLVALLLSMTLSAIGCSDDEEAISGEGGLDASADASSSSSMDSTTPDEPISSGDTGDAGSGDAGIDDAMVSLPPAAECGRYGDACTGGSECCSGVCDATSSSCGSSAQGCSDNGANCTLPTDCCNLSCGTDGKCGSVACVSDGDACTSDTECCGNSCAGDVCQPLNTDCRTSGNACTDSDQCCSGLCTDDKCQIAASFCIQEGDICGRPEDCCTARCDIEDGSTVGVCGEPSVCPLRPHRGEHLPAGQRLPRHRRLLSGGPRLLRPRRHGPAGRWQRTL